MEPSKDREIIDEAVMKEIASVLEKYGVKKENIFRCYNDIRFQIEARAVLLNRVSDRSSKYYGRYLERIAQTHGVNYKD